ncbi:ribosomal protection-like ABC-F family protein [Crassaminicella indica]|uniref:ABC-F family ATP-binding cassette domain-containing protein n=1 Tax=Crassaminicella indica TaxID=2855394 RepID=A0ABX8R866_9CLOT|nr:ABC-F family ATP-binding cassette domain-containing protein [Crassaminicella indica]QXM05218.1 ABC-F family ATP-binding cassette domain-containing protein [Crassaminicella indica]
MIILSCNDIHKFFGINAILENISFSINAGEKIGLVGANGAGKSTLFKIITGEYPYDNGELYISKNTTIGYLEQSAVLSPSNTVFGEVLQVFDDLIKMEETLRSLEKEIAEHSTHSSESLNKLMELYAYKSEEFQNKNGYGYRSEIRGVLKGLGFSEDEFDQPIIHLSGGQKTRVNLAKLLLRKPDILLLDEPTNHLDIDAVEWLEAFLKSYHGTILLISHDRYFLDEVVDKIYEIENKKLTQYNGNYSDYVEKKKVIYEQQMKEYLQQQKEIQRQESLIRKFKQHGTEKLAKRAKSREKRLEHISLLEKPVHLHKRTKIRFETQIKSGEDVLTVEDLSKSFGSNKLFQNVSFTIYRGERVGLIGPNGIGKSTLLKILLKMLPYDTGIIRLGHNVHIGYYDQEQSDLNTSNTIIDEIWEEKIHLTQTEVRTLLGSFLFSGEDVLKKISTLSGGEKSRVALLKLMLSKANFLLIDEPTNHLDIASKEALEEALTNYDGTILVISHDRYFLNKVTTKILDLSSEGITEYLGNYKYYQEKKKQLEDSKTPEVEIKKTKTQLKDERRKEKEKQKEKRRAKKERESLEETILSIEENIRQLEQEMCKEEIYSDPKKSKELHQKMNHLKIELDNLYEKWEEYLE